MSKLIPIHERFSTFQGEGIHAGRHAHFIRTFGCPVQCPWCDSAGTWHKDYKPAVIDKMSVADLVAEAVASTAEFIVLTGGEPTIHELYHLVRAMHDEGIAVHVETCGGFPFKLKRPLDADEPVGTERRFVEAFDWVTISPKRDKPLNPDAVRDVCEFKIIVDSPDAITHWLNYLTDFIVGHGLEHALQGIPIWLHPEWSQRDNPAILSAITEAVKTIAVPFGELRAGYQMHKLFKCDALDKRSAPLAPLGGNPAKGY